MFATKGRLEVALLVVGVLIFGLGLYAAFRVQEVEADYNSPSCTLKQHKVGGLYSIQVLTPTSDYETFEGNCSSCGWSTPDTTHVYRKYLKTIYYTRPYYHKYPWQGHWTLCHNHNHRDDFFIWRTELCGG